MKRLIHLVLLASLAVLFSKSALAHPLDKILELEQTGTVDDETLWRYKILGLYHPADLPAELQDAAPTRCVTWALDSLRKHYPQLSPANKALLAQYNPRLAGRSASSSTSETSFAGLTLTRDVTVGTDNYRIHYTFTGADATNQTFVDNLASVITETVQTERDTLGYAMPRYEDGESTYHVYLSSTTAGSGVYGFVQAGGTLDDNPKSATVTEFDSLPSYMVLQSRFPVQDFGNDELSNLKATFAHEHFHAVQNGMTSFSVSDDGTPAKTNLSSWLNESSATWMETQVYPTLLLNYPEYVEAIFGSPFLNHFVKNSNNREYASFLSHQYIGEHASSQVLKNTFLSATTESNQTGKNVADLWKAQVDASAFGSLLDFLKEYTIATILRSATVTGGNGKYTFAKASEMQFQKGGQVDQPFTYIAEDTFTGTTLTRSSNNLIAMGANYYALTLNQTALITITSVSNGDLTVAPVKLTNNEDLSNASSRTSVGVQVGSEVAVASGGTGTMTLGAGKYVLRILKTNYSPTSSTTMANYNIQVQTNPNPVTISCSLAAETATGHPHVGDVAVVAAIVAGVSNSTACADGACDFNKDSATAPAAADVQALANIVVNGDGNSVCGSTFGN